MLRRILPLLLACLAVPAQAQHVPRAQGRELQDACGAALARYCPGAPVTVQPQTTCLRQYYLDLPLACRNALKRRSLAAPT